MKCLKNMSAREARRAALAATALTFIASSHTALAAGGLDKVNEGLENIKSGLTGVGLVIITLAIMWAAYKLIFGGANMMEIIRIFGGAMVLGSAGVIAGWFI
ncbi:MAG: TrbC/VirB2 family protein [Azoarcus sp.]|jgi:hypothetical protein|nr:TrbC/VirB2 family protein [Azoarcus sp.]